MRQSDLPIWVWDILIELEEQRDTHPKLFAYFAGKDEPQRYDWCPCALLDMVPPEVVDHARAIREYVQAKERKAAAAAEVADRTSRDAADALARLTVASQVSWPDGKTQLHERLDVAGTDETTEMGA